MKTIDQQIKKYHQQGILIDTNLLLLYVVGVWNQQQITRFKRTKIFTKEDYRLLSNFLSHFKRVITTPNILTEVSNLAGQLAESLKTTFFPVFANKISVLDERYLSSSHIARSQEFYRFGLTDTVIQTLARNTYLVITEDFRLAQYLQHKDIDTINFNHLRYWGE